MAWWLDGWVWGWDPKLGFETDGWWPRTETGAIGDFQSYVFNMPLCVCVFGLRGDGVHCRLHDVWHFVVQNA